MAYIYRLTAALFAVFFAFQSSAIRLGNDKPNDVWDDSLFDYAFGKRPLMIIPKIYNCHYLSEYLEKNLGDCQSYALSTFLEALSEQFPSKSCVATSEWDFSIDTENYKKASRQITCTDQNNKSTRYSTAFTWGYSLGEEGPQCPPEEEKYIEYRTLAYVGEAPFCWNVDDLNERDSCPNSTSDGDYVLPVGNNQSEKVCLEKDDGSFCAYQKNGDVYVADFERSCYDTPSLETAYDAPDVSPADDNECAVIASSSGIYLCPEDPQDKCTVSGTVNGQPAYSSCETGCGYVDLKGSGQSTFQCISSDEDGDGIPDVRDPDYVPPDETDPQDPTDPEEPEDPTEPTDDSDKSITTRIDRTNYELAKANQSLASIDAKATQTNSQLNAVNSELDNIAGGIGALNNKSDGILTEVKKITAGDTSGTPFSSEPSTNLTGFYTPVYENGFQSIWSNNEQAFNNSSTKQYIEQWKVTVNGDFTYPSFCFDLGFVNLGCHVIEIDGRILSFIRIILIISALILARQITLGG